MRILEGKPLATEILDSVKAKVETFVVTPVLRVYCDDTNQPYYKGIIKDAAYCGIKVVNYNDAAYTNCDGAISLNRLINVCDALNMDGGETTPCTAEAVMRLLTYYDISVAGKNVCIIGRSERVGKPLARLMTDADATVTLCHSMTDKFTLTKVKNYADIVVGCVGGGKFVFMPPHYGRTIIDIGGDFEEIEEDCCANYAPVKGGVGPVTRAVLMEHVMERYMRNRYV